MKDSAFKDQVIKELNKKRALVSELVSPIQVSEEIQNDRAIAPFEEATRLFYRLSAKIVNTSDTNKLQLMHIALTILSQAMNIAELDPIAARRFINKAKQIIKKSY